MAKANIYIGTSGWAYPHWKQVFYPKGVGPSKQLPYYAEHFNTVELNSTFYRLPSEKAVNTWFSQVPEDFIFAVKASRFITHNKKLGDYTPST